MGDFFLLSWIWCIWVDRNNIRWIKPRVSRSRCHFSQNIHSHCSCNCIVWDCSLLLQVTNTMCRRCWNSEIFSVIHLAVHNYSRTITFWAAFHQRATICRWSPQTEYGCSCLVIQKGILRNCPFKSPPLAPRDCHRSVCLLHLKFCIDSHIPVQNHFQLY